MTKQYPVVYEWAGKNFAGYAPDVPGCMATAPTLRRMRTLLKSTLEAHLKWISDDGDTIPAASEKVTVDLDPDTKLPRGYYVIVEKLDVTIPKQKTAKPNLNRLRKRVTAKRRTLQAA